MSIWYKNAYYNNSQDRTWSCVHKLCVTHYKHQIVINIIYYINISILYFVMSCNNMWIYGSSLIRIARLLANIRAGLSIMCPPQGECWLLQGKENTIGSPVFVFRINYSYLLLLVGVDCYFTFLINVKSCISERNNIIFACKVMTLPLILIHKGDNSVLCKDGIKNIKPISVRNICWLLQA